MAKKRKKKLNAKQASRLWGIIVIIYFICAVVNAIVKSSTGVEDWIMGVFLGTTLVAIVFLVILNPDGKEAEEKYNEIKARITKCLSSSEFTQVYFICKEIEDGITTIFRGISENEECKYFAKITENDEINLIVIDKYDQKVYDINIQNFHFFNRNFKFEE